MSHATDSSATVHATADLADWLTDPRPRRRTVAAGVRALRQQLAAERAERRAVTDLYAGGMAAERASRDLLRALGRKRCRAYRQQVRGVYLSRVGRRIDLAGVLRQRRPDGLPRWALLDPAGNIGPDASNGKYDSDGTIGICGAGRPDTIHWLKMPEAAYRRDGKLVAYRPAGGIPPLPPAVRRLATDRRIRRRALWVGLLYQPEEWAEARPDPALVAEWKDRPGEYYALAVWGGDRARIMEWCD